MANLITEKGVITAEDQSSFRRHKLELDGKKMSLTGIKSVPTFTSKGLSVELEGEALEIVGKDLSVVQLDVAEGVLILSGKVNSIRYTAALTPTGFLKKLFK